MQRKLCEILQYFSWLYQAQSFKKENVFLAGSLLLSFRLSFSSNLSLNGTDDFFFSDFLKSLMTRLAWTWVRILFKQWLNLPESKTDDVTTQI